MSLGAMRNEPCPCRSGKKFKNCCLSNAPDIIAQPDVPTVDSPGLMVLMPSRGRPMIETLAAVQNLDGCPSLILPMPRMSVDKARNELAAIAPRVPAKAPFKPKNGWFCLWVDDDAFWEPRTVAGCMAALYHPGVSIVAGYFCGREPNAAPKAWRRDGTWPESYDTGVLIEVHRIGFHFVMHRIELLEELLPQYPEGLFTVEGSGENGEDFAFCKRAIDAGKKIYVHTNAPVAHVDDDGTCYLPFEEPMRVIAGRLQKILETRSYDGSDLQTAAV